MMPTHIWRKQAKIRTYFVSVPTWGQISSGVSPFSPMLNLCNEKLVKILFFLAVSVSHTLTVVLVGNFWKGLIRDVDQESRNGTSLCYSVTVLCCFFSPRVNSVDVPGTHEVQ